MQVVTMSESDRVIGRLVHQLLEKGASEKHLNSFGRLVCKAEILSSADYAEIVRMAESGTFSVTPEKSSDVCY